MNTVCVTDEREREREIGHIRSSFNKKTHCAKMNGSVCWCIERVSREKRDHDENSVHNHKILGTTNFVRARLTASEKRNVRNPRADHKKCIYKYFFVAFGSFEFSKLYVCTETCNAERKCMEHKSTYVYVLYFFFF